MNVRPSVPADNAALRRLAAIPMPGPVRVAYLHEPSFFAVEALKGFYAETNVLEIGDGNVCGAASRMFKCVWIDGEKQRIGYIGNLRLLPEHRGSLALFRGYDYFRKIDATGGQSFYFTTIIKANTPVIKLLTAGRRNMPRYAPSGELTTYAMTGRALRKFARNDFEIVDGETVGADALFDFYQTFSGQRHLFPVLAPDMFGTLEFAGLSLRDFIVVRRGTVIEAVAALWDQTALRQLRVESYAPALAFFRPVLNVFLRFGKYPTLPRACENLNQKYLAFPLVRNDDPRAFSALLRGAGERLGTALATFALHDSDPLRNVAQRAPAWRYASLLYFVHWDRAQDFAIKMARPFHVELSGI